MLWRACLWSHGRSAISTSTTSRKWLSKHFHPPSLGNATNAYSKGESINAPFNHATSTQPITIFSGIQPTGIPHLGNYLGALQQWVKLQNSAHPDTTLIYSLVDLHAITLRQDPAQLRQWRRESLAMLIAVGLRPDRSIIFHQSDVPAHTELMWILSCQAGTGSLSRMTQWKDKTAHERENSERLKLGLFSYPVLQAADVLVHGSTHVPVGHDQAQHLEFARELAISFNHLYGGDTFVPPETIISPAKRIMSLSSPYQKMSKSHTSAKSRVLLTDTEDEIRTKIKAAVTDSENSITYDQDRRPGVSNLLDILFHCSPEIWPSQVDLALEVNGLSMRALKDRVADAVEETVAPIRARFEEVMRDEKGMEEVGRQGGEKARRSAEPTMERVRTALGLL